MDRQQPNDDTYERSEKEIEFRALDKTRLIFLGQQRGYDVFKHPLAGGYWTTRDGDFVSHHAENPLPRD
ncbi:MAG: hypothetical protein KIT02_03010 [Devosia sp.]|uniref:hypothetical protein n=1 Tax=Devosia sp. TaxID=1871048 RepID=UPI0024CD9D7C|nr:hypothetical protein [Devosia sp.]UYO00213.1 MAG: hypothetical protein KIT02_03010 [Devosia sp.]